MKIQTVDAQRRGTLGSLVAAACLALAPVLALAQAPTVVKAALIKEMTGPSGFANIAMKKGIDLALDEVNATNYLGATKLALDLYDTASVNQNAVTMVSQAIAKPEYIAILGPSNSDAGAAVGPIAQRAKMPIIFSQSLGEGVLVGNYTYRVSGPLDGYYGLVMDYLKSKGVKTVSVLYTSTSVRQGQAATEMLPALAKKAGMTVVSNTGVPVTNTDFTALASKIATEKPDAVVYFMSGAQHVTAVQQVVRAGYKGVLIGGSGIENSLATVGPAGENIVWVAPFNYTWPQAGAAKFTKAFQAKFAGENPLGYAAEGYDAVWLLARAIKAGGPTREAVQKGLAEVTKAGFEGAQGKLAFVNGDAITQGVLVQWTGGKQVILKRGDQ